jgi:hypothetical protein
VLARIIPTKVHAAMDYGVGALLVAAPWLFGFADESTAAAVISVLAGLAVLGMSAVTNHEGGFLAHAITMRTHLMADAALGVILGVSPWLFGFADNGTNAWLPFVLIGLVGIGTAALTNPFPGDRSLRAREAAKAA